MSRKNIGERVGRTASSRVKKGNLTVIESKCPYCNHNKALVNSNMGRKCSKCKQRY